MFNWFRIDDLIHYGPLLAHGLSLTLFLSLTVMVTSLFLGLLVAICRYYRLVAVHGILEGYVYLVRSIPVVMLIALVHFGLLPALGIENSFMLSAFVGLSLSTTAYVAEILRGGFTTIHQEEYEAATSLGLNVFQQLLYVLVPLVLSRMMPTLVNQFVTLIKDTSLASIIGVIELTRASEIAYEHTMREATILIFVALIYFVLCYGLSRWSRTLESKNAKALQNTTAG